LKLNDVFSLEKIRMKRCFFFSGTCPPQGCCPPYPQGEQKKMKRGAARVGQLGANVGPALFHLTFLVACLLLWILLLRNVP
jgi:hypothetical protein